jgi:hypothetical protein
MPKGTGDGGAGKPPKYGVKKDGTPKQKTGQKGFSPAKKKAIKEKKAKNLLRNPFKRCSFLNRHGDACLANPSHYDEERELWFCLFHKHKYYHEGLAYLMEHQLISKEIDALAKQKGVKIPKTVPSVASAEEALKRESIAKVDAAMALPHDTPKSPEGEVAHRVRFVPGRAGGDPSAAVTGLKHGGFSDVVEVLDLDYYAPDYKNDHVYLLDLAIRRAHAKVNMLFRMLAEVEENAENVKMTEMEGEVPLVVGDGIASGRQWRRDKKHIDYYTLRLKVHEQLEKAEANYAKLMKQKEDLVLTALLVLKREGIRFSREAAMMVLKVSREAENKSLDGYHASLEEERRIKPEQMDILSEASTISEEEDRGW